MEVVLVQINIYGGTNNTDGCKCIRTVLHSLAIIQRVVYNLTLPGKNKDGCIRSETPWQ